MTSSNEIVIQVDGFPEEVPAHITIAQLIQRQQAQHKDLLVEVNGRFVHPREYATRGLKEGDRVEFILAAFGG